VCVGYAGEPPLVGPPDSPITPFDDRCAAILTAPTANRCQDYQFQLTLPGKPLRALRFAAALAGYVQPSRFGSPGSRGTFGAQSQISIGF